jgi:hypothetical protein
MKRILGLTIPASMWLMMSCGTNASKEVAVSEADSTLAPVETREANADFKPAFEGQTRVAAVKTLGDSTTTRWTFVDHRESRLAQNCHDRRTIE